MQIDAHASEWVRPVWVRRLRPALERAPGVGATPAPGVGVGTPAWGGGGWARPVWARRLRPELEWVRPVWVRRLRPELEWVRPVWVRRLRPELEWVRPVWVRRLHPELEWAHLLTAAAPLTGLVVAELHGHDDRPRKP